ncbi:MAG: hypothetical protein RIT25_1277 [Planctomycetota bacterium]
MMRWMSMALALLLCALAPTFSGEVRAQDPPQLRQEQARAKFRELHERMQKMEQMLASSKPEESKLLSLGNKFVVEKRLHESMADIRKLLDGERFDEALEAMKKVRQDLSQLLELLQNRDTDLAKLLEELQRLEGYRNRVDQLAKDQTAEKDASARTEDLQKQLQAIAEAKAKVDALLKAQQELRAQANEAGLSAAPEAAKEMARREGELKQQAEQVAKELERVDQKAEELAPKPAEGQPAQPAESKPASAQAAGSASKSMGQAQQQLGDNKPESSLKDQDQAIEQLQKAQAELDKLAEEAKRELLKLPFDQQAKKQDQTQGETDKLAKEMEKDEAGDESGEGAKPTPGRKQVQQAVPKQKAAAGQLKEEKPAKRQQQDAKEDLEAARDELDEAIAQLRQQLQDEILRALEERFTAMLAKQKELTALTAVVDSTRKQVLTADGNLPASLVEKCQNIGTGEFALGTEAADALKLLDEEGTTAVFPEIVTELRDDLYAVAKMVRANDSGAVVQSRQAQIEDTLALLIDALRKNIERREGG